MGEAYRLGILTALWRRPAIAETVLRHLVSLEVPGVDITVCAVRSPEDSDPTPDVAGVVYASAPNRPLSDKWNAGMQALRDRQLDAVMIVGSDDLVTPGYVAEACGALLGGCTFARPLGLVFVDTETGEAHRSALRRIGLGRTLSAELLDRVDWTPWPKGLGRRLDGGMDRRLAPHHDPYREAGIPVGLTTEEGFVDVCDLKSAVNIWDYQTMKRVRAPGSEDLDAHAYLSRYFPIPYADLMAAKKTPAKTTKTTKKAAAPKSKPDPKTAKLRALKNLQPDWTGLGKRVFRGEPFEVEKNLAERLVRDKLAQDADKEFPPPAKTRRRQTYHH